MKFNILKLLLFLTIFFFPRIAFAQNPEKSPKENKFKTTYLAIDAHVGGILLSDEYLSPMPYGGITAGFDLISEQALLQKTPLILRTSFIGDFSRTLNPAHNMLMQYYRAEGTADFLYRFILPHKISIALGGGPRIMGGARLHSSNVNNIADADFQTNLSASMMIAYMLPVSAFPAVFRLYSTLGLFGIGYKVGYGQSYYEKFFIDKGIGKSLHFTHFGNNGYASLLFSVDMPVVNVCTVRLGYRLVADKSFLENRLTKTCINGFFLGLSWESIWYHGRKGMISKEHTPALFAKYSSL